MYRMNYWGALALIGSLVGCTADKGETDSDAGTGDTTGSTTALTDVETTAGTDATDPTATTVAPTTGEPTTTEEPTTGEPTTGDPTTGGVDVECDPRAQDCPEGLKCTAYAKIKTDTWDANKCVPETGDGVYGDPCTVEDGIASGIDDCAKGYICQSPDEEGKNGVCLEFCQPDDACPNTTGVTFCINANDGVLPICSRVCDPLVQDCPGTQGCYGDPSDPTFFCYGPDPKDGGQDGSKCEFTNACLAGLHCAPSATLEGCPPDSMGCCTPFCPLDGDVCTGAEQCVAFFDAPEPGAENIGVCVLPE